MEDSPLYARCDHCGTAFDLARWRELGGDVAEFDAFAAAHEACETDEVPRRGSGS